MTTAVSACVITFADFLNAAYANVLSSFCSTQEWERKERFSAWAQGNWECLVEYPLRESQGDPHLRLEFYGDGTDFDTPGCRYSGSDVVATHEIVVIGINRNELFDKLSQRSIFATPFGFAFDRFVSLTPEGWYREAPPFDHVMLADPSFEDGCAVVDRDTVEFVLRKIAPRKS